MIRMRKIHDSTEKRSEAKNLMNKKSSYFFTIQIYNGVECCIAGINLTFISLEREMRMR